MKKWVEIEFSDVLPRAQEHKTMQQANETPGLKLDQESVAFAEAAHRRAEEKGITFAEGLREIYTEDSPSRPAPKIAVSPASVLFAEAAQRRAAEKGIDYGSALREVYAESSVFLRADGIKREILVAAVENGQAILNAGAAAGLTVGTRLNVQRLDREITDPASGQVIRKTYLPIGEIVITKLDDVSADAKGANVGGLKVGDVATVIAPPPGAAQAQ